METILSRHRNLIVLMAVLFVQVMALAIQVKRPSDSGARLIRVWAVSAVTPLEKAFMGARHGVSSVWGNYLYLRGVRAENRALREELTQLRLQQARVAEDAAQARRLQTLLEFKRNFVSQTMPAQVIGTTGSEQSRAFYIDKGSRDGIKPDMAVITPDGIVGKVKDAFPTTSLVLVINDQSSGVGAILQKSRLQGILKGTPSGEITLQYVMSDETVEVGDRVLTSGGDRIFPKGLSIGTVTAVSPGRDLFLNIRVKPAAQLSRVEEVLVITRIDDSAPAPDLASPVRAADILAERLPTVPPKPETPAPGTPGAVPASGAAAKPAAPGSGEAPTKPAASTAVSTKPAGTKPPAITAQPNAKPSAAGAGTVKPAPIAPAAGKPQPGATAPKPLPGAASANPPIAAPNKNLNTNAQPAAASSKPQSGAASAIKNPIGASGVKPQAGAGSVTPQAGTAKPVTGAGATAPAPKSKPAAPANKPAAQNVGSDKQATTQPATTETPRP